MFSCLSVWLSVLESLLHLPSLGLLSVFPSSLFQDYSNHHHIFYLSNGITSINKEKLFFPTASIIPAASFFFLAYKETDKLKLKLFATAGTLALGMMPYTILFMLYTNKKLLDKADEAQGLYADQVGGDTDDVSSGSGRKHKKSSKDRERSDRSYKKSSSSKRKEVDEHEDVRTAHELVDHWSLLNLGRSALMIASAAVGTWTVVRYSKN